MKTNERLQPYYAKKKSAKMEIITCENIKVTESHWLYTGLSMIAEIGGYVGLFLGVSIIQINHVFASAIKMAFGTPPTNGNVVPTAPHYLRP